MCAGRTHSEASPKAVFSLPLTERVLDRLGRPRWLWIAAWSLVPLLSWSVFATAIVASARPLEVRGAMELATTRRYLKMEPAEMAVPPACR
ncbi:MAG TPA: hypothetical protein VFU17_04810 [Candidatus Limnocylindrales bacterium]|nr:hypothetical protein [Candidatus Limnocylindrales bacterium]